MYGLKLVICTVLSLMRGNYSNYVHLFVVVNQNILLQELCRLEKVYSKKCLRNVFKEYSEIKNSYLVMNCGVMEITLEL